MKHIWLLIGILVSAGLLLTLAGSPVAAFDPPGVDRAIAAQEAHNPQLLANPNVVGTAVGLTAGGVPTVTIFTTRVGVAGLPASLDGVPVVVQVTGKLFALHHRVWHSHRKRSSNDAPLALFTYSCADLACGFDGSSSSDADGSLASYAWAFGDGMSGSGVAENHSYAAAGTYTVTLTVSDDAGATDTDSQLITVSDGGGGGGGAVADCSTTDVCPQPVPIGVSTGNKGQCSAGTIAARVTDGTDVYALSNNHVYALTNKASIGSKVLQPGRVDTNCGPGSVIGTLADFEPIVFDNQYENEIDAAIAKSSIAALGNATPSTGYGTPQSATALATFWQRVQKFGRTSELTKGLITHTNATLWVGYSSGTALFVRQIIVESADLFIKAGDSGSLLVTDPDRNPVGLLFAGNWDGTFAVANPIDLVLMRFGVTIDGE